MNFGDLNDLIHSKTEKIALTSDIVFSDTQDSPFADGIEVDVDSLVIDGEGHLIDGAGKARIFNINAGDVTLKNIVFKNAFSMEDGGAVKLNGGNVHIENCRFIDNKSNGRGGCLYCMFKAKLNIANTQFFNNHSSESGCIHNMNASVEIIDSEFHNNRVEVNASVILNQIRGRLQIKNTVFKNNVAVNGGVILNFGKCEISDSVFGNNFTSSEGGAINNQARSRLNISNTLFIENESVLDSGAIVNFSQANFDNVVFFRNSSKNHAGVISNQRQAGLKVSNSLFLQNSSGSDGGSIINWGRIHLNQNAFENNSSKEWGGAIFNQDGSFLTVHSCDFTDNSCVYSGGAIFNSGNLVSQDSLFKNNVSHLGGAINSSKRALTEVDDCDFLENSAEVGSAIFNNSERTELKNCRFSDNSGGSTVYNFKSLRCIRSFFIRNCGEDIVFNDDGAFITFKGCRFMENSVENSVFHNRGAFSSLREGVFMGNEPKNDFSWDIFNKGYLSIFAMEFDSVEESIFNEGICDVRKMNPSKIHNLNVVNDLSRIIRKENDFFALNMLIHDGDNLKLDSDYRFEAYEEDFYEGGIEITSDGVEIDGKGHSIDGAFRSRILVINARDVVLKNIVFKNGVYFNDFDSYLFGGGAITVLRGASLKLENCIFSDNYSNSKGGAISSDGVIRLENCKFENNKSETVGGAINNNEELILGRNEFVGNSSKVGGAIYSKGHLKIEKDITFKNNRSAFHQPIYNAGLLEGSNCRESIYDCYGISENHDHDSFSYLMDEIRKSRAVILDRDIIFDFKEDFHLKGKMDIGHDLVIDGKGHSIEYDMHLVDGAYSGSLFRIRGIGTKVILRNLVFRNCYSNGRNIIDNKAELTIENCRFINNRIINDECLIDNSNILKIRNSHFSSNMSSEQSLIMNGSKLEMSGVRFTNNNSLARGACIKNDGEADIEDAIFKSNDTKNDAGCIDNGNKAKLKLLNVKFEDNHASGDAGVIFNHGEVDISNSRFAGNTANHDGGVLKNGTFAEVKITDSEFILNESKTNGGVIFNFGNVSIANSKFIKNRAKIRSGAIEHTIPYNILEPNRLKISNTQFKDNSAMDDNDIYSWDDIE